MYADFIYAQLYMGCGYPIVGTSIVRWKFFIEKNFQK